MKIAVDPGHGGRDPGAVGFITEVDIVYPWADELVKKLNKLGCTAQLTHRKPPSNVKVTLEDRVEAAEDMKADLYISVHADSWTTKHAHGASAFVYSATSSSYSIAEKILPALQKDIGSHGGTPKIANFHVLRETSMPAVLLETGFVTNPEDGLWLMRNYKKQAKRVAEVIAGLK